MVRQAALNDSVPEVRREAAKAIKAGLVNFLGLVPSGKHTKNYGTSPFFMGKSTIPMVNCYKTNWKDPPFLMGKSTISTGSFSIAM